MFDIKRKTIEWGGKTLTLETGRMARQADGAVLATYGETMVLATAVFGFVQFARWAYARGTITRQITQVTFLASPARGWPDLPGAAPGLGGPDGNRQTGAPHL